MNKPVTKQEVKDCKVGQSVGGKTLLSFDEKGNPIFYPNRKERRSFSKIKKTNNRKTTRGRKTIVLNNIIKDDSGNILSKIVKSILKKITNYGNK